MGQGKDTPSEPALTNRSDATISRTRSAALTRTSIASQLLMAAAAKISPDLITIASQRHHLITSLLLGSVIRKVVREGSWSMLITPPVGRRRS
ncbi:MAG: universal stress protein [Gemmatimonadaceae bacterium]